MMDDDNHEIEEIDEEANTSTNASRRTSCLTPGRQALADSMIKSVTASVSKFKLRVRPTIYIVPQMIRQVKEVAYEPQKVSIGPYHHGNKSLQGMEEHKWLYLHSFLSRNPSYRLEDYLEAMEELEDEARSCYSDKVGPQMGNEFVKMMVLDACFLLELFLRINYLNKMELESEEEVPRDKKVDLFFQLRYFKDPTKPEEELEDLEDPILTSTMMSIVLYDMFLLENQIPFFVLQRIFIKACPVNLPHKLAEMALDCLDLFMPRNKEIQINDSYRHLLHLFHSHLIPTPTHSKKSNSTRKSGPNKNLNLSCNHTVESVLNKFKNMLRFFPSSNKPQLPIIDDSPSSFRVMKFPCATDLQLAGVKFKKNEKSNNILNVKFSHGVLEITPFMIHYYSETLFRNLVAFEQCYPGADFYFTTYLNFMDFLVNTSKDVALLHRNGIIFHLLGSDDEVANLFNGLCCGSIFSFEGSYLSNLKDDVQKHCENKRNMWWASLKRDYFTNPWSFISLMAASILLLLTITQTFFTVFPYHGLLMV